MAQENNSDLVQQVGLVEAINKFVPTLKVKRLSENATLPERAFPHSAGYDLFSRDNSASQRQGQGSNRPKHRHTSRNLRPHCTAGRSSMSWHHSIEVGGGVVDLDKNPVFVILFNLSDTDFQVKVGDNIAQMVIEVHATPEILEVQ
ncbi:deoxyuridine 5'-triphosphate nucleotidohydrolase-like isoform X2 [Ipomoea triloba]|uniref:deoxyuridine 5'-triphosphate nucleotidohydrolase-like isoform X2 n=1 Tax=Ipomoea triloba TaxID=35885 RepID=UPI00125E02C5|nr:deoxyuridine 5'-triphosphate nucleotidohydrolase-like isoform X2 [Ipomoea triloba]